MLLDWLALHQEAHLGPNAEDTDGGKCWYSEMPIGGKGDREVEHFRPKRALSDFSKTQRDDFAKYGWWNDIKDFLDMDFPGYDWLAFKPSNYRLSSASVNMQGNKGSIFPILKGTQRLTQGSEAYGSECAILLDPTASEDVSCIAITITGEVEPTHDSRPDPNQDFLAQWEASGMKWLRAAVSIVVYNLNHSNWVQRRKKEYAEAQEDAIDLVEAVKSGNSEFLRVCEKKLRSRCDHHAAFAGASRTALAALATVWSQSSETGELLAAKILHNLLKGYS